MKEGELVKCADEPWCGGYVQAKKIFNKRLKKYVWRRFILGHNSRNEL